MDYSILGVGPVLIQYKMEEREMTETGIDRVISYIYENETNMNKRGNEKCKLYPWILRAEEEAEKN